jgi:hypothetical protein
LFSTLPLIFILIKSGNAITRQQALTWLAQLFYNYTDADPVGFLKDKGITSGKDPHLELSRYELAVLGYRAANDTGSDIHYGLFDAPAPKLPHTSFGQEVANSALAAVGEKYPYVNSQYTFCARFVRTLFEKAAVWPDAKSMCGHYDNLGLIQITKNPPAGAAICYLPGDSNWDYGHVAIAIGDGTEVGATSLTNGIYTWAPATKVG